MREIKFRVWDGETFYYVDLNKTEEMIETVPAYIRKALELQNKEFFTGLKDKNGVDIYEGDIVKVNTIVSRSEDLWEQPENYPQEIICKVMFNEEIAAFDLVTITKDEYLNAWGFYGAQETAESMEVIGSQLEHPHLLKPQE